MDYSELCEAFEKMDAKMKALFIDTRLAWATNGMLLSEVSKRIYNPQNPNDDEK